MNVDTERYQLTTEQRLALQAVYDHFHKHATWPTFITIDRPLRRTHGLDIRAVLLSLPDELIVKPRPSMWFNVDDEVRLRLSGIEVCQGSSDDADRFVRLLRWLAQKEVGFEPAPDVTDPRPQVTDEDVREHLGLPNDEQLAVQRVIAMLDLDHWGTGGWSSGPDGWIVYLTPDIWRFRDVQTIEDCIRVRAEWIAEAQAAVPRMRGKATPPEYFHVRLSTKSGRSHDEVRLDLSNEELESRFLAPYREGRPFVINGKTIPIDDLAALRINRTDQPSDQLRPIVKAERRASNVIVPIGDNWYIAAKGIEVTDQLITEPPGNARPLLSSTGRPAPDFSARNQMSGTTQGHVVQAGSVHGGIHYYSTSSGRATPSPSAPLYVDSEIAEAIRSKHGTNRFDVAKLLSLIDELNDNYAKRHTYSTHMSLRAILDHVPPILGCADFNAVANNYQWSRTDKSYMKALLEFKHQADDALHRQISGRPDLLRFDHLPSNLYVNHLLQECADKL